MAEEEKKESATLPPALPPSLQQRLSQSPTPTSHKDVSPHQQQQVQCAESASSDIDPRYARCAFCQTKHPRPSWGSYKETSKELSDLSFSKFSRVLPPKSYVCEDAYNYIMGTTENVPPMLAGQPFGLQARSFSNFESLIKRPGHPFPTGIPSSGSFNNFIPSPLANVPAPAALKVALSTETGLKRHMNNDPPEFLNLGGSFQSSQSMAPPPPPPPLLHPPDLDRIINEQVALRLAGYAEVMKLYADLDIVLAQIAGEQEQTRELLARLEASLQSGKNSYSLPPSRKLSKKDLNAKVDGFARKAEAIASALESVSSLGPIRESVKKDFNEMV